MLMDNTQIHLQSSGNTCGGISQWFNPVTATETNNETQKYDCKMKDFLFLKPLVNI